MSTDRPTQHDSQYRDFRWLPPMIAVAGLMAALVIAWHITPSRNGQQVKATNRLSARTSAVRTYQEDDRALQRAEDDLRTGILCGNTTASARYQKLLNAVSNANWALTDARTAVHETHSPNLDADTAQLWGDHAKVIVQLTSLADLGAASPAVGAGTDTLDDLWSQAESDLDDFVEQAARGQ